MTRSDSKYLLDLAAANFGWSVKGLAHRLYERGPLVIEVYFTTRGSVRAAYFTNGPARISTVTISGGVPAITDELKRLGSQS